MAALALVVSPLAAGCASTTESARGSTYGYNGAGQQYRYQTENVASEWDPADEGDGPGADAPPVYADADDSEYKSPYVYRGGRDPRTSKAPNWSDVRREGG